MEYRCNTCGCRFERLMVRWESRGEFWGFPAQEEIYCCPSCGDTDYEEEEEYEYDE